MSTKIDVPELRIRYHGLFDFPGTYAAVQTWCKDHGYYWQEEITKHKVPSPRGAEQETMWSAERLVTDYINYRIELWNHTWDMTEATVQLKGKKKKLTNARVEFWFKGTVTYDWQNIWKGGRLVKWIGGLYDKYIMRRDLEAIYVDGLIYSMYDLHALVKKNLDMQAKAHEYRGYMR